MLNVPPGCGDALQAFGDVFADLAQFAPAAKRASHGVEKDDLLTRQVLRQRTARRAAALEAFDLDRIDDGDRNLCHDGRLGQRLLQIFQRQFQLFEARTALR